MTILTKKNNIKDIYLDHASTTPLRQEVFDAMYPYFTDHFGNPSSSYRIGDENKRAIRKSREIIARSIHARENEIYFTSGGTESDTWAITGICKSYREKGNHIITSSIEHSAILNTCKNLEKEGYEVTYLPVDKYGFVQINEIKKSIRPNTILMSIMFANNEIGTIQPIKDIGQLAKENNILFHTDAVQAYGQINIDVQEMNIDLLTLSSHKIYGPKGIGTLFIKEGVIIAPLVFGGSQERGRRPGTENLPGIIGFAKAVELMQQEWEENVNRLKELRDYLIECILTEIEGAQLNGHREKRLPGNANFSFRDILNETLLIRLNDVNIFVSTGSACTSGSLKVSHVLKAIGLDDEMAQGSIRISLGNSNTKEQVNYFVGQLKGIIKQLRYIRASFRRE